MLDLSHLTGQESTGYRPPIIMASALTGEGSAQVWEAIEAHVAHLDRSDQRRRRRQHRIRTEVRARIAQSMSAAADAMMDTTGADALRRAEAAEISPNQAAKELLVQLLGDPRTDQGNDHDHDT